MNYHTKIGKEDQEEKEEKEKMRAELGEEASSEEMSTGDK